VVRKACKDHKDRKVQAVRQDRVVLLEHKVHKDHKVILVLKVFKDLQVRKVHKAT
jgi:hypothetical protein